MENLPKLTNTDDQIKQMIKELIDKMTPYYIKEDVKVADPGCSSKFYGSSCTDQMLEAAMKVAVREDLIAPYGNKETYQKRRSAMKLCIEAALGDKVDLRNTTEKDKDEQTN